MKLLSGLGEAKPDTLEFLRSLIDNMNNELIKKIKLFGQLGTLHMYFTL